MNDETLKKRLQEAAAELETLRDEVRLNLHLAGMDLREEWKNLEKRLPDRQAAERLMDATCEALDALTREVRGFKQRMLDKRA